MTEAWDEGGSWGCSVWNILVWGIVCGITGRSEQGHRRHGGQVEWSFSLVQLLRVEDFILIESNTQSTLSEE